MVMTDMSIIVRYSRIYCERRLSDLNIGYTEQLVLMYLCKGETVNQDTIAKHFMLDKGAIAKTLNKLEEKKFITRTDNSNNKREKLVSITEQGNSIFGVMNDELQEWHDILFEGLTKEEVQQFAKTAERMSANAIKIINRRNTDNEDAR